MLGKLTPPSGRSRPPPPTDACVSTRLSWVLGFSLGEVWQKGRRALSRKGAFLTYAALKGAQQGTVICSECILRVTPVYVLDLCPGGLKRARRRPMCMCIEKSAKKHIKIALPDSGLLIWNMAEVLITANQIAPFD